jgi:hypothetical protein
VAGDQRPTRVTLRHALPRQIARETLDGVAYEVAWRGDEIPGIRPNTDWLPFYPSLE